MRSLIFISLIAWLMVGCDSTGKKQTKNTIFVSIKPQQYMVEQIAGETFSVKALLPPGASPAVFEPSPGQLHSLSQSIAYIRIGEIGFENAWMEKIKGSNQEMKIFDQSRGVRWIKADHHHGHDHVHHHNVDPHIWTSPVAVSKQIENIKSYLTKLKPDSATYFEENAQRFAAEVADLDKRIQQKFEDVEGRTFMIYHPALTYFARDYQLEQIALEKEGKEPSGKYMAELIKKSKALGIKTIFVQKQFPVAKAEVLANELDAKVEVIDPLAYNWIRNMEDMASRIARALNE